MQWANYWRNIVQHYHVICEGWPAQIPFKNLSEASTSLPELQMLHKMWKDKLICWRLLDEDEYQRLQQERSEKLDTGEIVEPCRRPRSDKGKKCVHPMDETSTHRRKKHTRAWKLSRAATKRLMHHRHSNTF
jgi:hypothetical protein